MKLNKLEKTLSQSDKRKRKQFTRKWKKNSAKFVTLRGHEVSFL